MARNLLLASAEAVRAVADRQGNKKQFTSMEESAVKFLGTFVSSQFYYWAAVVMLLIHVGFLAYEGGVARNKNVMATMTKNLLTVSVVGLTFFLFGFWVYNAFPLWPLKGPIFGPWLDPASLDEANQTLLGYANAALPWDVAVGPTLADHITPVFLFAFALFAMTTGSIMSGAVIERIKMGGFLILATILGSVLWVLAGAWGWHYTGWFSTMFGYHDFGCSAVVHGVAGFFTLGVLIILGPRIGRFVKGKAVPILPHNLPLTLIGLMCIYVGFFGFLAACAIMLPGYTKITTIYGSPMTLASIGASTFIALSAGFAGAYISSKGDPFFTVSGGLAGIVTAASGMDLYPPGLVLVLAFGGAWLMPKVAILVEKCGIDDVVGAFSVHGFCGLLGAVLVGVFAGGYVQADGWPPINLGGQILGALICCIVLGFLPGLGLAWVLAKFNLLRVPPEEEVEGLDATECGIAAYPEKTGATPSETFPVSPGELAPAPVGRLATES